MQCERDQCALNAHCPDPVSNQFECGSIFGVNSLASQTYFARARILRAHVYCARRKEGRGENTSGVFGQVFVCTAGMLAVPIRLQYRVININNT